MQKQRKKRNPLSEESGIYFIINVHTAKIYVGSALNLKRRHSVHFSALKKNKHPNYHLRNSFNLYGSESFLFLIVETCGKDELLELEQKYIDILNVLDCEFGYNICPTAGNLLGYKHTEESKRKMSNSHIGKKHTEEHKQKISEANTRRRHSEESKQKMSKAQKGKPKTEEHKRKVSKKVIQLTKDGKFVNEFYGTCEAERQTNIYQANISSVCRGKLKSAGGYIWRYVA